MTDIKVRFKCAASAYSSAFGSAGMRVEHHVGFHTTGRRPTLPSEAPPFCMTSCHYAAVSSPPAS